MLRRFQCGLLILVFLTAGSAPAQKKPQKNSQPEPTFEPFKAEKSIEIGLFYMKKKNYDAAIDRFQDALRYKPGFARPHLLLGKVFERKGDYENSILHYNAYLEILPNADDEKDVRKRIAVLEKRLQRAKSRQSNAKRGV